MSARRTKPRFLVGEKLLRPGLDGGVQVVEIIGSTGRAPYPTCLLYRYEDGTIGQGTPKLIYRPGPAFDAYLSANNHLVAMAHQYGAHSPQWQAAYAAMARAEDKAFRVHPAGAAWRDEHPWSR
jgi:hypothetical protein